MGRPRRFKSSEVVAKAGELFWEQGFGATSIGQLEESTGLDRSSLYHAFGSKQALFEEAARCYVEANIDSRLAEMELEPGGLEAVAGFFDAMARSLRAQHEVASRGCMVVNAIAELPVGDPFAQRAGTSYRDRFRSAFGVALARAAERGEIADDRIEGRSRLLTSMAIGLFVSARLDPVDAASAAEAVAEEVATWGIAIGTGPTSSGRPRRGSFVSIKARGRRIRSHPPA